MEIMPDSFATPLQNKNNLLDILLSGHLLTDEQYREIKVKSAMQGVSEESILGSLNLVSERDIAKAKAKTLGVPFITLSSSSFSPQALGFMPASVAKRFLLIPFAYDDKTKTLSVAMNDPADLEAISFIRHRTGLNLEISAAEKSDVEQAIDIRYRQGLVSEIGEALKETSELKGGGTFDSAQIAQIITEAPIAKIVATILDYAVVSRASDVHIEPQEDRTRVRYRIDGVLYDKLSLPKNVQDAVTSRVKILSGMKIDEHRIPQDGRFNFKTEDKEVDLRISVLPTVYGEKTVMRLLRKSGGIPGLEELGLTGGSLRNLETGILRPHGIIIVCGPTGSGKTTTLYSVLSRLNTTRVNIVTLEDPIEYQIAGINQVGVNPAVGLTFATGLRSFLRQDPNIILVGEIRDPETTDLAIQAALTGHLVFSTLHTSSAAGALPRLIDLGAQPFLLASTMNVVVAQRIARKICGSCKEAYSPLPQLITEIKSVLGKLFPPNFENKLYRGKGCDECGDSGYLGRIGIFETLPMSQEILNLISQSADSGTIEKQAVSDGMITMKQDGYIKAIHGITTIEEVLRVAQE